MREIGGSLVFEKGNTKYFEKYNAISLNTARNAIAYVMLLKKYNRIFIPVYLCETVKNTLRKYEIDFIEYNINENYEPVHVEISKNECILIVNYFGILSYDKRVEFNSIYKNVIFDNTQAFFAVPIENSFNIYSTRKFLGVPDGAYLIGNNVNSKGLIEDNSYDRVNFLFKALELGSNVSYRDYLNNEMSLNNSEILKMSKTTKTILSLIDLKMVRSKRNDNFQFLNKKLSDINELNVCDYEDAPFMYPLLIKNIKLRKKLIDNNIYVPCWWKHIIKSKHSNEFEKYLTKYLIPLPIDQRYDINDMQYIVDVIYGGLYE